MACQLRISMLWTFRATVYRSSLIIDLRSLRLRLRSTHKPDLSAISSLRPKTAPKDKLSVLLISFRLTLLIMGGLFLALLLFGKAYWIHLRLTALLTQIGG